MRVLARDLASHCDSRVAVVGWLHRVRDLGGVTFAIVRDRTGFVQAVFDSAPPATNESVVEVRGTVVHNDRAPGGHELQHAEIDVVAPAHDDLPFAINQRVDDVGIDTILDNRLLSLRHPKIRSIFEVQSTIVGTFASYLRTQEFTEIKSSKLIGSGTEGGTGLFSVDYFGESVYLAQSPQFYKQAMVASGLERVFEVGAAYRAEKHDTPRHLNEYTSLDIELAYINDEYDLMDIEIEILAAVFDEVGNKHKQTLEDFGQTVPSREALERTPRITFDEARQIISERSNKRTFDITPDGERVLTQWALDEHGVDAVFVARFPRKKRPFYTYPEGTLTRSFDMIFRGLEITTGGRRINEYKMLLETLPKFGLTEESLGDYPQVFRYGCPPHGGFALGLERVTMQILGLANVKEATLFPRDRKRTRP